MKSTDLMHFLEYHRVSFGKLHPYYPVDGCTYLGSVRNKKYSIDLYLISNPLQTTLQLVYGDDRYRAGCDFYVPNREYGHIDTFESPSHYFITLAGNIAIATELMTCHQGVITPEIISQYGEDHLAEKEKRRQWYNGRLEVGEKE